MERGIYKKNCKNLAENPSPEQDFIEQILDQVKKYETLDEILHAIHKLSLGTDACFHCVWLKHKVPGKIINCTGIPKLCSLKHELFNAWPPKFYKGTYLMTKFLLCDTMKRCQIMAIHPHMAKIIAYYDLMIYRYYSPVWNRNAEGKLQAEEDGGDNDDDDDDNNNNNNNNNKKEEKIGYRWTRKRRRG